LKANVGIDGELVSCVSMQPASKPGLQSFGKIPMIESDERGQTSLEDSIYQPIIIVDSFLVYRELSSGEDTRPGDRKSVNLNT
jgi:hypothetical protein